jgi:hypothetical protein
LIVDAFGIGAAPVFSDNAAPIERLRSNVSAAAAQREHVTSGR